MGRVIKKEEQPDATPASLGEEEFYDEPRGGASARIPAEKVDPPEGAGHASGAAVKEGRVLESDQTRTTAESVLVEPVAPASDPAPPDAPPEQAAAETDAEPDSKEETDDSPPTRTDAEWREHLEEAVEEARAEGYDAGREEGYEAGYEEGSEDAEATLRAEWDEERETLVEDMTRFEDIWSQYIDENESRLVELALRLAEVIVDAPLSDSLRRASEEALTEAVAELAGTPPVTITVHPVDYQRLHESGLAERLTDKYDDLQLESDPDCAEGDWTVASPAGVVRRRRSEVIDTLRDHLRLSASDPEAE